MNGERIDTALEAELEWRAGRSAQKGAVHLQPAEQTEVDSLVQMADLVWEAADREPPPLEADKTAAMLGLVPDPAISLDVGALKRYRKTARLKQSDLAARLTERGWQVATKDVFAWETKSATGLCPALIRAIAEAVGCQAEQVMRRSASSVETVIEKVAKTQRFTDLTGRWAGQLDISFGAAKAVLLGHMTATANRGSDLSQDRWLEALERLDPHEPHRPPETQ